MRAIDPKTLTAFKSPSNFNCLQIPQTPVNKQTYVPFKYWHMHPSFYWKEGEDSENPLGLICFLRPASASSVRGCSDKLWGSYLGRFKGFYDGVNLGGFRGCEVVCREDKWVCKGLLPWFGVILGLWIYWLLVRNGKPHGKAHGSGWRSEFSLAVECYPLLYLHSLVCHGLS